MSCKMTREELQKQLQLSAYGRNEVIYDAFLRKSSDGGHLCRHCNKPIPAHEGATPQRSAPPSAPVQQQQPQPRPPPPPQMQPPSYVYQQQPQQQQMYAPLMSYPLAQPMLVSYAQPAPMMQAMTIVSVTQPQLPVNIVLCANGDRACEPYAPQLMIGSFIVILVGLISLASTATSKSSAMYAGVIISACWVLWGFAIASQCQTHEVIFDKVHRVVRCTSRRLLFACCPNTFEAPFSSVTGLDCVVKSNWLTCCCCTSTAYLMLRVEGHKNVVVQRCHPTLQNQYFDMWTRYLLSVQS